jgi:hypothetical protein
VSKRFCSYDVPDTDGAGICVVPEGHVRVNEGHETRLRIGRIFQAPVVASLERGRQHGNQIL